MVSPMCFELAIDTLAPICIPCWALGRPAPCIFVNWYVADEVEDKFDDAVDYSYETAVQCGKGMQAASAAKAWARYYRLRPRSAGEGWRGASSDGPSHHGPLHDGPPHGYSADLVDMQAGSRGFVPKSKLEVLDQSIDDEQCLYRVQAGNKVHHLTISGNAFYQATMGIPYLLIPQLPISLKQNGLE